MKSQLDMAREAYSLNPTKENARRIERMLFAQRMASQVLSDEGKEFMKRHGGNQ